MDLKKEEIIDTYKIGENGNFEGINDCYIDDTSIFVGNEGVYFKIKTQTLCLILMAGPKHPSHSGEIAEIIVTYGGIIFNNQYPFIKVRNSNGYYLEFGNDFVNIYQDDNLTLELNSDSNFNKIQDVLIDKNNVLWVGAVLIPVKIRKF